MLSGEWQRMKRWVVRGRGHLLGLRRASSAEHHRRHTLGPHGDRADVGRQHEGLAPAEVRRGSPPCGSVSQHAPTITIATAFTTPHSTHVCRALGCDAAVRCGAAAENAREGAAKGRGVRGHESNTDQTIQHFVCGGVLLIIGEIARGSIPIVEGRKQPT